MQCRACPVKCGADRTIRAGACGVRGLSVAKAYLHPYEEPPISYRNGSGTVFFCGCNLRCVFCQNFDLSRARRGKEISPRELADLFRSLEERGADNINLVTPDHVTDFIGEALSLYRPRTVVYNSSGYVSVSALRSLDPYLDVYLPDLKFFSPALSARYTGRADYFDVAREAIAFMAKKPLVWEEGKLLSGVLVRHMPLPSRTSDSLRVLEYLREVLPADAPLSLLRQYTPMGEIQVFPELNRRLTAREYARVKNAALALGFSPLYTQDKESADTSFIPDWDDQPLK